MVIKLTVSKSGFLENFVLKVWEAQNDALGAEVFIDTTTLIEKNAGGVPTVGAGHQISEEVVVNGMDAIVHIVRIYGAVSGIKYTEFNVEPENPILTVYLPVFFKIGDGNPNTPLEGESVAVTPELAGLVVGNFTIIRNGVGALQPGNHYDFTDPPSGEWTLIQDGDQFGPTEEITILIQPVVTNAINDSVVGKMFGGFLDVAANIDYDPAHLRKLIRFSGSPEYSFLVDPPIGYSHIFNHYGAAGTAKIKFTNAPLLWDGAPKTELDIPQYSQICVSFDGSDWNVVWFVQGTGITAPVAGNILGVGVHAVGDVVPGDPVYIITHNLAIVGDYILMFSLKSNSETTYFRNNKVGGTWWHHISDKPNKVNVSLQEIAVETQTLAIAWVIFKI